MKNDTIIHKKFNRHTGDKRHLIKDYDKVYEYRGFTIKRNKYVPNGAENKVEVPDLLHINLGREKKGFFTVSEVQAREAIDEWYSYNIQIKKI